MSSGENTYSTTADDALESANGEDPLVEVRNLKKYFHVKGGLLDRNTEQVRAVDDVSFSIPRGQTFGLVGESGCGKTTLGKTLLRLEEPTGGTVEIDGTDLSSLSGRELKNFRQHMQIVFQDPTSSLNPRKRIKQIISEPLRIHGVGTPEERRERVQELMDIVGLPDQYLHSHPSALSGGQKQRVSIARSMILNPKFVVLDEPTSALDVSVQARIVDLFENLQDEFDLTYLFISHDLSLVRNIADWIGVMYLGELVEIGPAESVFRNPQHPYTRALISSIPTLTEAAERVKPSKIQLNDEIPDPREKPSGCPFRTRCPEAFGACSETDPSLQKVDEEQYAACLLHDSEFETERPDW